MYYVLAIILIALIGQHLYLKFSKSPRQIERRKENQLLEQNKKSCSFYKELIHIGGNPMFDENQSIRLKIRDNKLFLADKDDLSQEYEITRENLINYNVQTEKEISNNITIPRVLVLGALSLIAQKQTTDTEYFLILTLKEKDVEFQSIYKGIFSSENLYEIITAINRWKLGYAKN